jgi:hypothetical protein
MSKQRWPKLGEKIEIDYGQDPQGQWWWRDRRVIDAVYGPYATLEESEKASQVAVLGPQCEVQFGGNWDPAWDRKQ